MAKIRRQFAAGADGAVSFSLVFSEHWYPYGTMSADTKLMGILFPEPIRSFFDI
jgi:hypothetical protein